MLQLRNQTPLPALLSAFADEQGIDSLFLCIKATFELGAELRLAQEQESIDVADVFRGDPAQTSLLRGAEVHTGNAGTDVLLLGHAYAPRGEACMRTAVSVRVAERSKVIAVYGDRRFRRGGGLTRPEPFERMPLVYERAFGGLGDPSNPVGCGLGRHPGDPVPNLESPDHLLEAGYAGEPVPVGFAPTSASWLGRRRHAGTYDRAWAEERAPYLPLDFDKRFFNVAAPELAFDRHLEGGEDVEVLGASARGPLEFSVPRCGLRVTSRSGAATQRANANLERLLIRPDDRVVSLTWRAKFSCDRNLLGVEEVALDWEGEQCAA